MSNARAITFIARQERQSKRERSRSLEIVEQELASAARVSQRGDKAGRQPVNGRINRLLIVIIRIRPDPNLHFSEYDSCLTFNERKFS